MAKPKAAPKSVTPEVEAPTPTLAREERIRLAAYAAAEKRNFAPGFETADWLEAEKQVDEEGDKDVATGGA